MRKSWTIAVIVLLAILIGSIVKMAMTPSPEELKRQADERLLQVWQSTEANLPTTGPEGPITQIGTTSAELQSSWNIDDPAAIGTSEDTQQMSPEELQKQWGVR